MCLAFSLFFACLFILQEKHANEEVKEEEGANKNKDDKETCLARASQFLRSIIYFGDVNGLIHDVRPSFKRGNNEKCHHGLPNVVKIGIKFVPGTSLILTNPSCVVLVWLD